MRTIGVVTVARSDYGIYVPILRRLRADADLRLHLMVAAAHLSPEFGSSVQTIENDGFAIGDRVEMSLSSDSPAGVAKSMGLGMIGFAQAYARGRPDLLMVLGDRFEMCAAALAALPFKIPVAHVHGGEITQGAIDDALRHSMTKLSHLHFVSAAEYARRIVQLGEEPWRVVVSGAPAIDNVLALPLLSAAELEERWHLRLQPTPLLVTFHPVTLEFENTCWHITELLAALEESALPVLFTAPGADTAGRLVLRKIEEYVQGHPETRLVHNLGTQAYFSLMGRVSAMVGNSSSGIIEAPSFRLPVVNIGSRQQGRVRAANVLDVGYSRQEILAGIRRATSADFRHSLRDLVNPFGAGHAAEIIVQHLKEVPLDDRLLKKHFHDLEVPAQTALRCCG